MLVIYCVFQELSEEQYRSQLKTAMDLIAEEEKKIAAQEARVHQSRLAAHELASAQLEMDAVREAKKKGKKKTRTQPSSKPTADLAR